MKIAVEFLVKTSQTLLLKKRSTLIILSSHQENQKKNFVFQKRLGKKNQLTQIFAFQLHQTNSP